MHNTKLILDFLLELDKNNNKQWMDTHQEIYLAAKDEFYNLTETFIQEISKFDNKIADVAAKHCIYRMNRDIRFSNDKTPYKNWMGAYINAGGKNNWSGGYYIHLQNEKKQDSFNNNSLIAAGLHCPDKDWLFKTRLYIAENGEHLVELLNNKKIKKAWGTIEGEKLKKAPRDFDENEKYIELIKMKSYDLSTTYSNKLIEDSKWFIKDAVEKFKLIKPINDFFNTAIGLI